MGAHLISRFVDRRFYLLDEEGRGTFLDCVEHAHQRWDWKWLAYALMSSHTHLALIAGLAEPHRFFRSAHTRFSSRYHKRRAPSTLGPVFADRPKLYVVEPSRLLRLVAYVHRNPVTAGVVSRPSESTWTSHRAYLRLDPAPAWLDVERALSLLGFEDSEAGRRRFDSFVMEFDDTPPIARETATDVSCEAPPPDAAVDWKWLESVAREFAGLPPEVSIRSGGRQAGLAKKLIVSAAVYTYGSSYRSVAEYLGVRTGSAFNMLERAARSREFQEIQSRFMQSLVAQ